MSTQSFAAAFKPSFKTTPAQYVLSERLKWARWLLANTNISISAVAAETGFSSQSHLTAVSRRLSGDSRTKCAEYPGSNESARVVAHCPTVARAKLAPVSRRNSSHFARG